MNRLPSTFLKLRRLEKIKLYFSLPIVSITLSIPALTITGGNAQLLRWITSFVLVAFLPGFALAELIVPKLYKENMIAHIFICAILSVLMISPFGLLLNFAWVINTISALLLVNGWMVLCSILLWRRSLRDPLADAFLRTGKIKRDGSGHAILLLGLVSVWGTSYYFMNGLEGVVQWDTWEHVNMFNMMTATGHYRADFYVPAFKGFTMTMLAVMMPPLTAVIKFLNYFCGYYTLTLALFGLYTMVLFVLGDKRSALLSSSILPFWTVRGWPDYYGFLPQTMSAIISMNILTFFIVSLRNKNKVLRLLTVATLPYIFFFHPLSSLVLLLCMIFVYFSVLEKKHKLVVLTGCLLLLSTFLRGPLINLSFLLLQNLPKTPAFSLPTYLLEGFMDVSKFDYDSFSVIRFQIHTYTPIMFPVVVYWIVKSLKEGIGQRALGGGGLATFLLIANWLIWPYRFLIYCSFFVSVAVISFLDDVNNSRLAFAGLKLGKRAKNIAVCALLATLTLSFVVWSQWASGSVSRAEFDAGNWIAQNTPKESIIVSDPATNQFLQAYTLRKGVGVDVAQRESAHKLWLFFKTANVTETTDFLYSFKQSTAPGYGAMYVVISPRTSYWVSEYYGTSSYYGLGHHSSWYGLRPWAGYNKFLDEDLFKQVYHKNDVIIFQLVVTPR